MSESQLKIRSGSFEFEFSGSEEFLRSKLPAVMSEMMTLVRALPEVAQPIRSEQDEPTQSRPKNQYTTHAIAIKLGVSSSPDLFVAACAKLQLCDGKAMAGRIEILNEMKSVPSLYSSVMGKNLSYTISTLIRAGRLNEPTSRFYSLTPEEQSSVASRLQITL